MKVLADLHVHSKASVDGKSSIRELCRAAKVRGIDAIAICDHDLYTPVSDEEGILVISGIEITTESGHVLGLFLQEAVNLENIEKDKLYILSSAVEEIHRCGGVAVLAHPFAPQKSDEKTLKELPVDAIETANARAATKKGRNEKACGLAEIRKLPVTGGSDAHCAKEIGGSVTVFECEELSDSALKESLLAGKTDAVVKKPCRWLYKGFSLIRYHWNRKEVLGVLRAYIYFAGCIVRDLLKI